MQHSGVIKLATNSFLIGTLAFEHDALQFFKDGKLLVGGVHLGVALAFAGQKSDFFEPLQFTLDVAGIFFDQLGKTPDVGFKVRIFRINHDDFAAHA